MNINIIVAVSENHVIGVDNRLPWHLPADLKYFKNLTTGHAILMGRKTFDSIGKPLPNRENIVITHNKNFKAAGIIVQPGIEEALNYCRGKQDVFIIGGDTIYKQTLPHTTKIFLTRVHVKVENGTAFFSDPDKNIWSLVSTEFHDRDDKNKFNYSFEVYERK